MVYKHKIFEILTFNVKEEYTVRYNVQTEHLTYHVAQIKR